jgi:transcriptional regulator with XRE-family HTH domain
MSKLKQAMRQHKLSEAETARRLGIAQSALNRITNKGDTPTLTLAAKIVEGFNGDVSYSDLLGQDAKRAARKLRGKCLAA